MHVYQEDVKMYTFSLSGRTESVPEDFNFKMATPMFSHMVGQCFQATEEGSYFEGTGFLKAGDSLTAVEKIDLLA